MFAFLLLITSALLHALWNYALKRSTNKVGAALAFMVLATAFNGLLGLATASMPAWTPGFVGSTLLAGLCEGVYFYFLTKAYFHQSLGVAYTVMRGGAMVLVWLWAVTISGETLTLKDAACVVMILAGIGLVQKVSQIRDFTNAGLGSAYLCALCIAGYHLSYGAALKTQAAPAVVFALAMSFGVVIFFVCDRGQSLRHLASAMSRETKLVSLGGLACGLSFLLFLSALGVVQPGRAISIRNASVLFGALLSLLDGEKRVATQWGGMGLVAVGVMSMGG